MSTWDIDNFDSDSALNCLDELIQQRINQIRHTFTLDSQNSLYGDYGEGRIVANIDILITLCSHYEHLPSLKSKEIADWKENYLQTYDKTIQHYRMDWEYIPKRRAVIEATFDNFEKLVKSFEND